MSLCRAALAFCLALPVAARADEATDALVEALGLPSILVSMSIEGRQYSDSIAQSMFPGRAGEEWGAIVATLYDPDRMEAAIRRTLASELAGADVEAMIAFFSAEPGRTIASLEASARAAMLDPEIEALANETAAMAIADETERYDILRRFIEVNDLIETNVAAALNSTYAFYVGLAEGSQGLGGMTEEDILAEVWANEPDFRQNTTEWLFGFMFLAYQPLSDAEIETYIAFSETEAGRKLNQAVFKAFDLMLTDISHLLGRAAARQMLGADL